jgi:hypothetical protein
MLKHEKLEMDSLETLKAEMDECVALLRPHYPDDTEERLYERAMCMRPQRYATGRWPTDDEIEAEAKKETERLRDRRDG